jgi:hypothetical protein
MDVDKDEYEYECDPSYKEKLEEVIDLVYYYTGGRIHDALKIVRGAETVKNFSEYVRKFVDDVPTAGIDLAIKSKYEQYGMKDSSSFDTLRTYYRHESKGHIQIVDSEYVLSLLLDKEMETKYLDAYHEADQLDEKAVAGHHFEKSMHKVFMRISKESNAAVPFKGYIRATGTTIEGVHQLEKNMYWMPSVPNFPGIDAALVGDDGFVFGVQYFARRRHGFNVRAFKSQFLRQKPQDVGADTDSAFIVFVVPKDQNGDPANLDEFKSRVTKIDCESIETVTRDAKTVFRKTDEDRE